MLVIAKTKDKYIRDLSNKNRSASIIIFNGLYNLQGYNFQDVVNIIIIDKIKYLEKIDTEFKKMFFRSVFECMGNELTEQHQQQIVELIEYNRKTILQKIIYKFKQLIENERSNKTI